VYRQLLAAAAAAVMLPPTFLLPLGVWRSSCSPLQPFDYGVAFQRQWLGFLLQLQV
jgi:hypothetical protein